jgi:4-hydroxy-tetrahydrodipicolinate synthase
MNSSEKKFVPVMITPFNHQLTIDLDAVSRLCDFYLSAGVKGLFANCLSSEMYSISDVEKMGLVKHIADHVNNEVPVVASGSFGSGIKDKAACIKGMYDTGVDAVILITSHFANREEDDQLLLRNFEQVFSLTGNIPLGLYECPAPYKRIISPDLFKTLLGADRLIYHKDTSIDPGMVKAKLEVLAKAKSSRLEFYDAHSPNATSSLQMGAKGMSSISGNFYPEIMVWICDNATNAAKQDEVNWIQAEINRVDPVIHQAYPLSAKYFLKKRGLPIHPISRIYVHELTKEQREDLDQIYTDFLGWCERLKIKPVI